MSPFDAWVEAEAADPAIAGMASMDTDSAASAKRRETVRTGSSSFVGRDGSAG
jgi:hypothetical protein